MAVPQGFRWLGVLQDVTTLEGRIVLTGAIVLAAALIARLLTPGMVLLGRTVFDRSGGGKWLPNSVGDVGRYTPWWASMTIVVRLVQLVTVFVMGIALLAVWGQLELALAVLDVVSLSLPSVVAVGLTLILFLAAYVAIDIADAWLTGLTDRSDQFSQHQEEVAYRVAQIVVFIGAFLVALSIWGVDLGGLLVGAGFLGIVAGMAAQQTLGSLIAGFVLMFSRPFEIGDWVEIGDHEGIVTEISIVNTRLENFDGEFVVLPNDQVGNATIVNRSKKGRLRIRVEVGVDYEADPDRAQEVAVEALKEVDGILTVPRPRVFTTRLADSAVVLELRFWIDKPSARRRAMATSAAVRAVKAAFDDEGIKIPYPQRELAGREEAGGFRVIDPGTPEE